MRLTPRTNCLHEREHLVSAPAATSVSPTELRERLNSVAPPRLLDVRTPAEFETAHIPGAYNVPLDIVRERRAEILDRLDGDVVFICRSGQRAAQAADLLRSAGLAQGSVLTGGIVDWEGNGFDVDRGTERWDIERQVRLVAGSIVLSSVLGSVAVPKLKWLAAAIGGGLTYAAVSNTCAMGTALSKVPYNRTADYDASQIVRRLGDTDADAGWPCRLTRRQPEPPSRDADIGGPWIHRQSNHQRPFGSSLSAGVSAAR